MIDLLSGSKKAEPRAEMDARFAVSGPMTQKD